MADIADTLITKYVLDDQYSAKAQKLAHTTDQFANSARRAHSSIGSSSGSGLSGAVTGIGSAFGKITHVITAVTAAVAGFVAAGAGVIDFGMKAMEAFAEYDTIERIFRGVYGSTKAAKEMMAHLNVQAQKGNFTFKDLAMSASKLVQMGLKFSDFQGAIEGIALRAGGGGEKLSEVTDALMRIKGGEMGRGFRTLKEIGIGPEELAKYGAVFDKSGEFVGNTSQALAVFQKLGDASKDISKAMEGGSMAMLSNIKESFTRVLASAGEGIFSATKGGIQSLVTALNDAIDSGAIKDAFAGIIELFTADASDISLTKVIASVLAGVQTAAAYVKMIWDTAKAFLDNPVVKFILKFLGAGMPLGGLGGALFNQDLSQIYDNSYNTNLAKMEHWQKKKAKAGEPKEPDNPHASNSPLAQIAENTKATADNTKRAIDMSRHVLGGGDLGRMGLTPMELDSIHGKASGASTRPIKVEVYGSSFDKLINDLFDQFQRQLKAQGALR